MKKTGFCITLFLSVVFLFSATLEVYADTKMLKPMRIKPTYRTAPASVRKVFTIKGGDVYNFAKTQGFGFNARKNDATSHCSMRASDAIVLVAGSSVLGSKCDFTLFSGKQINPEWKFVSYSADASDSCFPPGGAYTINERPKAGGRIMRFRIHIWTEALNGLGCGYAIRTIRLEGPANGQWQDAFR